MAFTAKIKYTKCIINNSKYKIFVFPYMLLVIFGGLYHGRNLCKDGPDHVISSISVSYSLIYNKGIFDHLFQIQELTCRSINTERFSKENVFLHIFLQLCIYWSMIILNMYHKYWCLSSARLGSPCIYADLPIDIAWRGVDWVASIVWPMSFHWLRAPSKRGFISINFTGLITF